MRLRSSASSVAAVATTLLGAMLTSAQDTCNLCTLGNPRNVNLEIPFLQVDERPMITCGQLAEYASTRVFDNSELCDLIEAHSDFCGCSDAPTDPLNLCPLCSNGATPGNLQATTPAFGDTCDELDVYLRFLPQELCDTERVQTMALVDFYCGCPGATADCYMCPENNNSNTVAFPQRVVPFWDPGVGLTTPQFQTCKELADSSFLLVSSGGCSQIQAYGDYCGCSSASTTIDACALCPEGGIPGEGTREIPALGMTCNELDFFLRHLTSDQCKADGGIADRYQLFDYYCGCPDSEPHCPICEIDNSADMTFPDRIVPFLELFGNDNPTCLYLATLGAITDLDSGVCNLIQAQGDFCGCPGAAGPQNACLYCDSGQPPANLDKMTQFGDTCDELATYVSFLPPQECDTTRIELIKQTDFSCGCPGSTTECALCNDGTFDIAFPDRFIPLLALPGAPAATCQEVVDLLIFSDEAYAGDPCEELSEYDGYCGCANTPTVNECTFCPGGETPANGDFVINGRFTCSEVDEFVSHMSAERCTGIQLEGVRNFAAACGCPNTEPACTLCPDGSEPLNSNGIILADTTCSEFAKDVTTFSPEDCAADELALLTASATCECPNVDFPQCSIQQNGDLCTEELLATTDVNCACYAFCDGEFFGCQSAAGGVLREDQCPGTPVSGCNRAGAVDAILDDSAAVGNNQRNVLLLVSNMVSVVLFLLWL